MLGRFLMARSGATSIEYGLIALLVALAIVTSVTSIGPKLSNIFTSASASLQ